MFAVATFSAVAQEAMPSQPQTETPADAPAAPSKGSGLLEGIGKLLKSPADLLPSTSKQEAPAKSETTPQPASPPTATMPAAPPSTASVPPAAEPSSSSSRLLPGMVSGREICPQAPNSGPDCQTGAAKLCQSKGYKGGRSMNIDTSFSCSAKIARATGKACGNEHFVTSAFCS